jgi:predicted RNA-binding Zn ribbon-like protein
MDVLCIHFINSDFRDFRGRWVRDELLQPGWLEQFLIRWNFQIAVPPDAAAFADLIALRSLLRRMIEELGDGPISEDNMVLFNAILLKTPVNRLLIQDGEGYRLEVMPLLKDWDWVRAEIAASFAHLLTDHDPARLKLCANAYCRGAFYDDSKSRTRRYCTTDKCANLCKVRRFRTRHQAEA